MGMVNSEDAPSAAPAPRPVARQPLPRWTVPVVAVLVLAAAAVASVLLWRWIDGLMLGNAVMEKKAAAPGRVEAGGVGRGGRQALRSTWRRDGNEPGNLELAQRERVQAHAV
jgi:hypothetical protein